MAIETNRSKQLKAMVAAFPEANQETARQMEAARQLQLQQTIGQISPAAASTRPAQQLGAQQVAAQGAAQLQVAKDQQAQVEKVGQLGLMEQGRGLRAEDTQRGLKSQRLFQDFQNELASFDENLKTDLLDKQLQFQKDEGGRTLLNQNQLLDFALLRSKNETEFKAYEQMMNQADKKHIAMLEAAHNKINQALEQEYAKSEQEKNQAQEKTLYEAKQSILATIEKEKTNAANKAAKAQAVGAVLGAGIGAAIGAIPTLGVGAGAGAAVGGTLGSAGATLGTSKGWW